MAARSAIRLVVTAAPDEGRGHLARGLALAGALRRLDGDAPIEVRVVRGAATVLDRERLADLRVELLEAAPPHPRPAVTVIDLPDPNELGADGEPLVVFDDSGRFTGRATIAVQPSLPSWAAAGTADQVLAGYAYAPLDERYLDLGPAPGAILETGRLPGLLVCFGGSDPDDVTGRIAPALVGDPRWRTTVVVGAGYRGAVERGPAAASVLRDPPDLPARLASCDLVVLGAGTMKFEAAYLGRPAILLGAADDQLGVGPAFGMTGAATYLGDGRSVEPVAVVRAVAELAGDGPARAEMSRRGRGTVDGRGSERLAAAILRLAASRS